MRIFIWTNNSLVVFCSKSPPAPPPHSSCAYLLIVSSLYVKLALHLCIIYLRGCGPHWRFYKWRVIPLCLTFIFKEACFNGGAVRRAASLWLAAAPQQHADARRHSAESRSTDHPRQYREARELHGPFPGCMSPVDVAQVLFQRDLGIIYKVFPSLFLILHCLIIMKTLSRLFPLTFSKSFCLKNLMMWILRPHKFYLVSKRGGQGDFKCIWKSSRSFAFGSTLTSFLTFWMFRL